MKKDEIVKAEIVVNAQELFQQFGLKKTTMDEIAAACGKAKSTLYHYFKNKEEVFDAVIYKELQSLRKIVKDHVEEFKTVKSKIKTYVIKFHETIVLKLNLYRIVKNEWLNQKNAEMYFMQLMNFEKSYITRILEDGYDSGEFTGIEREDLGWFSEILLAGFFGIVKFTLENEEGLNHEKLEKTAEIMTGRLFQ